MPKLKKLSLILIALTFLCLFSNNALAESISVSITGPAKCLVNEEVSFSVDVKEEWTIDEAKWKFGDLSFSSGSSVSHKYKGVGEFSVSVTVKAHREQTDADGVTTETSGSGSATKKVTCKGTLSIEAEPSKLPADGESTSEIKISALDCNGEVFNYNGNVKLSASDSKDNEDSESPVVTSSEDEESSGVISVSNAKITNGSGTATAKAGTKSGTATIKASGKNLSPDSCKIKVEEAEDLKLSISANPNILAADGKSTTTLTIKVLNSEGKLEASYNGSIKLKSSSPSALKVPSSVSIKNGQGTVEGKAGKTPGCVSIIGKVNNLEGGNCQIDVFAIEIYAINQNRPSLTRVYYHVKPAGVSINTVDLYFTSPGSSASTVVASDSNVAGNCKLIFNQGPFLNKEGKMSVKIVASAGNSKYSYEVHGENVIIMSSDSASIAIIDVIPSSFGYQCEVMGYCRFKYFVYCNKLTWQVYCPSIIRDIYKICESERIDSTITTINAEIADRLIVTDGIEIKNNGNVYAFYDHIRMSGNMQGWDINIKANLNSYVEGARNFTVHYYHKWGYDYYFIANVGDFIKSGSDWNDCLSVD